MLQNGEADISARSIRPAVIALIPNPCPDCERLLSSMAPQVGSFGVSLVAVGGPDQGFELDSLSDSLGSTHLVTLTDPGERLRSTYGLTGTTLLLVRADGAVVDVVRNPAPGMRLESALVELVPGVGTGT